MFSFCGAEFRLSHAHASLSKNMRAGTGQVLKSSSPQLTRADRAHNKGTLDIGALLVSCAHGSSILNHRAWKTKSSIMKTFKDFELFITDKLLSECRCARFKLLSSKSTFSQRFIKECIREVLRIGSIIIFPLVSKL